MARGAARRRAAAAAQPQHRADGPGRPRRPAARGRRLAGAAQPAHRHLRIGLQAGAHGLRRRRRQPHDGVHLLPPGARPRGGRRRRHRRPGRARPRRRPARRALPQPGLPAPRHHAAVPGLRARRLLDLLELPRGPALARHPHRQRGRGHRRLRRAAARAPEHGLRRARRRSPTRWRCWPIRGRCRSTPSPATRRHRGRRSSSTAPARSAPRPPPSSASSTPPSRWPPSPASTPRPPRPDRSAPTVFAPGPPEDAHRGAGRVVGRDAAHAVERAAGGLPGHVDVVYDTVGRAVDDRAQPAHPARAGHVRAARRELAGPVRVDAVVLQGAAPGRLERVRRRDVRGSDASTPSSTSSTCCSTTAST